MEEEEEAPYEVNMENKREKAQDSGEEEEETRFPPAKKSHEVKVGNRRAKEQNSEEEPPYPPVEKSYKERKYSFTMAERAAMKKGSIGELEQSSNLMNESLGTDDNTLRSKTGSEKPVKSKTGKGMPGPGMDARSKTMYGGPSKTSDTSGTSNVSQPAFTRSMTTMPDKKPKSKACSLM